MHYIGLDVGFGYTKAVDGSKTILYPSIVSPEVDIPFRSGLEDSSNGLDNLAITLEGETWFVGKLALRQGQFARSTLDRVRTKTLEYRFLFLTALALLAESPFDEFSIVTGLPVDDYDDRSLIEESLSGRFHITMAGRDLQLNIRNIMVVPQPYGALMDLIFKDTRGNMDERYTEAQVGIIDIGFKTTDFVMVNKGEFIQKLSGSLKKGISTFYQVSIPKLSARYPGNWDLYMAEDALHKGFISSMGKRIEIDLRLFNPEMEGLAEEIASWIQSRWSNQPLDFLVLSGGGSLTLKPFLIKAFPQLIFTPAPQQSNVRGFYKGAWYYYG